MTTTGTAAERLTITLAAIEISSIDISVIILGGEAPCQIPLAFILDSIDCRARARTRLFFVVAGPWSHFAFSRFFREV